MISKIGLIREELIILIKIHNFILEQREKHMLIIDSQEYDTAFNLFLFDAKENVALKIESCVNQIEEYEREKSETLYDSKQFEAYHL